MIYSSNEMAGVKEAGHSDGGFLLTYSFPARLLVSIIKTKKQIRKWLVYEAFLKCQCGFNPLVFRTSIDINPLLFKKHTYDQR